MEVICHVEWQYRRHTVVMKAFLKGVTAHNKSPPIDWARQNAVPLKLDPKPSTAAFSVVFFNSDDCRLEVASDVTSVVAVDFWVKYGANYSTCCWLAPFWALTRSIQLQPTRSS